MEFETAAPELQRNGDPVSPVELPYDEDRYLLPRFLFGCIEAEPDAEIEEAGFIDREESRLSADGNTVPLVHSDFGITSIIGVAAPWTSTAALLSALSSERGEKVGGNREKRASGLVGGPRSFVSIEYVDSEDGRKGH